MNTENIINGAMISAIIAGNVATCIMAAIVLWRAGRCIGGYIAAARNAAKNAPKGMRVNWGKTIWATVWAKAAKFCAERAWGFVAVSSTDAGRSAMICAESVKEAINAARDFCNVADAVKQDASSVIAKALAMAAAKMGQGGEASDPLAMLGGDACVKCGSTAKDHGAALCNSCAEGFEKWAKKKTEEIKARNKRQSDKDGTGAN